ncbi:MAG: hypothetical protein ACP5TO_03880 [Thermoplasmata archaeon]
MKIETPYYFILRELIAEVEYNPTIIDQLSLEYIPHYTTVQKFMERMKLKGLEYVFRKALLIIKKKFDISLFGYSTCVMFPEIIKLK